MSTTHHHHHPRRAQGQAAADLEQWRLQQDRRHHGAGLRGARRAGPTRAPATQRPRRGDRHRARRPRRRPPRRPRHRDRLRARPARRRPTPRRRRGPRRSTSSRPTPRTSRSPTSTFDHVLSAIGVMFTADHERAAGAGAGHPLRRTHLARELDPDRLRRPAAEDRWRHTSPRRRSPSRRRGGAWRTRCATCSVRTSPASPPPGRRWCSSSRRRRPSRTSSSPTTAPPTRPRRGSPTRPAGAAGRHGRARGRLEPGHRRHLRHRLGVPRRHRHPALHATTTSTITSTIEGEPRCTTSTRWSPHPHQPRDQPPGRERHSHLEGLAQHRAAAQTPRPRRRRLRRRSGCASWCFPRSREVLSATRSTPWMTARYPPGRHPAVSHVRPCSAPTLVCTPSGGQQWGC